MIFFVTLTRCVICEVTSKTNFDPSKGGVMQLLHTTYAFNLTNSFSSPTFIRIISDVPHITSHFRSHEKALLFVYNFFFGYSGRDSSIGIATRYGLDGPGIESRWGARFSKPVQTGPGAHPTSYTMGTGSLSRG
jgi:hypothetical protein